MHKKIMFIILVLVCAISYGQYEWTPGKLILKKGDTLKGIILIPMIEINAITYGKSWVAFKTKIEEERVIFDKSQIDKIYFETYDPDYGYYEYVPIKKRKLRLFKKLINGKAKLYTRTVYKVIDTTNNYSPNLPGITVSVNFKKPEFKEDDEYYIIRDGEPQLTPLISQKSLRKFKTKAIKYFSDCKEIVAYLNNDLYEEIDIIELVNDYNLICE